MAETTGIVPVLGIANLTTALAGTPLAENTANVQLIIDALQGRNIPAGVYDHPATSAPPDFATVPPHVVDILVNELEALIASFTQAL